MPRMRLGQFNADAATQQLEGLKGTLDTATRSAEALATALEKLQKFGGGDGKDKDPMGASKMLDFLGQTGSDKLELLKQLGKAIADFFTVGKAGADELKGALNKVGDEANNTEGKVDALTEAANKLGAIATNAQQAVDALNNIKSAAEAAKTALSDMLEGKEGEKDTAFEKIAKALSGLTEKADEAKQALASVKEEMNFEGLGEQLTQAFSGITEQIDKLVQGVKEAVKAIGSGLGEMASGITQSIDSVFSSAVKSLERYVQQVLQLVKEAADAVKSLNELVESGGAAAGAASSGFATGGLFIGHHGGIDSNLAWLTSGEFVVSVNAVRHWGVDFLHAINSMKMPRFAAGGLVPSAIASSAAARSASAHVSMAANQGASRMLSLVIEGKTFSGLSVPEKTAVALEKFAVTSQLASAGRKPNWKR